MQCVHDLYRHFCIFLQGDLWLLRRFDEQFHGYCAQGGWEIYCSTHTIQETLIMEVASPPNADI